MHLKTFTSPGWLITSRVFAAIIPGFILTNSFSIMLSFLWPAEKQVAVAWSMLLGWITYTCIIMWIFHVKSLVKVWSTLFFSILVTSGISGLFILAEKSL